MEDYRELQCIGRGSQGTVHTVRHLAEGKLYVLKRMHILEPEARRAALSEAETLHRLQHTAIVGYRDSFLHNEELCIVMEYCEGGDLAARLATCQDRPFTEDQLLQWLVQLALALHHVHDKDVLHRDIKTHNVFITHKGHLKLGDFGIAKLQLSYEDLSATYIGTPYYMSPEQFRGEPYGQKADVWALGCVFYEMCTRRRAFDAPNLAALSMQVMKGEHGPLPPQHSTALHDILRSLLHPNASQRPSVAQLLSLPLLRRYIASYAVTTLSVFSEEQQLADPSLAALRAQLVSAGLQTLLATTSTAAVIDSGLQQQSLTPAAHHPSSAELAECYAEIDAVGSAPRVMADGQVAALQEAEEHRLRVEFALRKLQDERKWRQQQRDARRAAPPDGVAGGTARGVTARGVAAGEGGKLSGRPLAQPWEPSGSPPSTSPPHGEIERQPSRVALHGRRVARPASPTTSFQTSRRPGRRVNAGDGDGESGGNSSREHTECAGRLGGGGVGRGGGVTGGAGGSGSGIDGLSRMEVRVTEARAMATATDGRVAEMLGFGSSDDAEDAEEALMNLSAKDRVLARPEIKREQACTQERHFFRLELTQIAPTTWYCCTHY